MLTKKEVITVFMLMFCLGFLQIIFPYKIEGTTNNDINLQYRYNTTSNAVTIIATAKTEFKNTKPTWTLSEDKKTYRKTYFTNQTYNTIFVLKNGSSENILLDIKQIDETGPNINVQYIYDDTNDVVTVKLNSNEVMSDTKPTWNLSNDKFTYTKRYYKNESYYTEVKDKYGNASMVKLNISQINGPIISTQYQYDSKTNIVNVTMKSNKVLSDTKPTWNLSKDKLTYTKQYNKNEQYYTNVTDIYGNTVKVKINVTQIKSNRLNGIDVSLYQGNIDWAKVKKSGIDFAMIRLGYRGYGESGSLVEDSMFLKNIKGASSNNIDIGVYFYTQAITETEAKEEAKFVLNTINKYNAKIKYPITIDTEMSPVGTGRADNLSVSKRTLIIKAFCNTIDNAGYVPMIYANKYWLNNNLDMSQLSKYDVWLAHYTTSTDYKGKYTMWQYTDKGVVSGITGNVDKSYCYKEY